MFLGRFYLLQFCIGEYCYPPVRVVGHHFVHDFRHLGLQLVDKLFGVVFLVLNVAQLLFPDTRQLAAFQQFFTNQVDEFDTSRRGDESLAVALDVMAFE